MPTRIVVAQLGAVASLVCLQSSMALAGDVVTLRCDFPAQGKIPAYYETVIADDKGISLTNYTTNNPNNELRYVKVYTDNSKDDGKKSYYRINAAEIAWGSETGIASTSWKFDSSIDLRTGIIKEDVITTSKNGIEQRPTSTGTCKPDRPSKPAVPPV